MRKQEQIDTLKLEYKELDLESEKIIQKFERKYSDNISIDHLRCTDCNHPIHQDKVSVQVLLRPLMVRRKEIEINLMNLGCFKWNI